MNKKKALFHLFSAMIFIGLWGLVGTAGAVDCDAISFGRAIIQYAISISLLVAGAFGANRFLDEGGN